MKTFVIENNLTEENNEEIIWSFLPDSALCNAGKPFFIPENSGGMEVFIAPIVKITRLGKSVAPRFATRYYSQAAAGLHFRDTALRRMLLDKGLPPDIAQSFDRSLILGDFLPVNEIIADKPLTLQINGIKVAEWGLDKMSADIGSLFQKISTANTLKMGDYLIPGLSAGSKICIGDNLELNLDNKILLSVQIK